MHILFPFAVSYRVGQAVDSRDARAVACLDWSDSKSRPAGNACHSKQLGPSSASPLQFVVRDPGLRRGARFAATIQFGQLFRRYICVTAMLFIWISSRVGVGFDLLLLAGPCSAESDARVPCSPLQFPRRPQHSGGHYTAAVPPLELAYCVANLL